MAPASFHHSAKVVCVMDASGQIGMSLARKLLQKGYTVHAAAQAPEVVRGMKGVSSEESKRLKVFHCDPFDYQSILDAMKGCSGLFYAFEPPEDTPTYDEYMAEVEVRAAHNVLEACAQTDTVEKVVFTSSVTAVVWKENRKAAVDLDERNWSEPSFCRKFKLWHALAKTMAEKAAWALAMDRGLTMVSINAGLLTGPDMAITNPYLKGAAEMYEDGVFVTVDVDFLVDAQVCIYEDLSAYGRYLCFDRLVGSHEDVAKLAQNLTPSAPCHPTSDDLIIKQRIHNKKLKTLMSDFGGGFHLDEAIGAVH